MNQQWINNTQLKILLTLQHISEDAQQWKENEKTDLDNSEVTTNVTTHELNVMHSGHVGPPGII